jgi:hypothetical protein
MPTKTFIVTYKEWVVEGDNYAGWAGYKVFKEVITGEKEMCAWLADTVRWNDPKLRNDPRTVLKVEIAETVDVTAKMLKAGKEAAAAEVAAERKMRAAELRAEAKKIEAGY